MPRKKRRKDAGLVRHVMSRGDGRERIFLDDRDYQKFNFLLQEMVEHYDVECRDICLIPNHFHLTLFHERENLSDAMQFLKGEFAIWWNDSHDHVGHVFEGPFKDQIVEEQDYALSLARYIALTPRELMREEAFRSRQRVIGGREFKRRMKPPTRAASSARYQPSAVFTPGFV